MGDKDKNKLTKDELILKGLPEPFDFEFHAELKDFKLAKIDGSDGEERVIEGYASTEDIDRGNEVTHKEAFTKSLSKFIGKNPLLTYMHKWDQPIGLITEAEIDEKGLRVKAVLAKNDPIADRVWNLIEQKVLRAFSFGYKVNKSDMEKSGDKYIKHIRELELLEVAVVSIPMNRNTFFSVSKAMQYGTDSINEDPVEEVKEEVKELTDEEVWQELDAEFTKDICEGSEAIVDGIKAGRVLNRKNRGAIMAALEALAAVLEADMPKEPKPKTEDSDIINTKELASVINSIALDVKEELEFTKAVQDIV